MTKVTASRGRLRSWNRRLHFYAGLYFLLFIWLFAVSGLFLNHSQWPGLDFWKQRAEATHTATIARPVATDDVAIARDLMRQLEFSGEIEQTGRSPAGDTFSFHVSRPGRSVRIEANLRTGQASMKETRFNTFGVLDGLHRFTGRRLSDPDESRDWVLTRIWSLAMDALALGICTMVITGLYLWYRLTRKRRLGLVVLGVGALCSLPLVFGFAAIF